MASERLFSLPPHASATNRATNSTRTLSDIVSADVVAICLLNDCSCQCDCFDPFKAAVATASVNYLEVCSDQVVF